MDAEILFEEHDEGVITDKPHCGDCQFGAEVTDKPHCGDCQFGVERTDKPHCGDCQR